MTRSRSVWRSAFEVATAGAMVAIAIPAFAQEGVRPASLGADESTHVVLEVSGLRNDHGVLRAGLFDRASTFLQEGHEAATCVVAIRGGRASCDFGAVPEGAYAIAFFHDENDDHQFGRDWIGLPTEGFGFSNDAAPGLGPPSYESARFSASGRTAHRVRVRYGL